MPALQVLPPCFPWCANPLTCFLWPNRSREEPCTCINAKHPLSDTYSRPLLILSILFHPLQLEGFSVALMTSGIKLLWNGRNGLGQRADTPDPKQVRLTKEHTGQSTPTPPAGLQLQPSTKAGRSCFEAQDKFLPGHICSWRQQTHTGQQRNTQL